MRQVLVQHYHLTAESIRPRDNGLVEQLLAQVESLLATLEAEEKLTSEEQVAGTDLRTLAAEAGMAAWSPLKALQRFTPFSPDAQPRIRGKCPLELAGYDVGQVPMGSLCAGLSVARPLEVAQNLVPNS